MLNILRGTGHPMTKDYLALNVGGGAKTKKQTSSNGSHLHMRLTWGVFKRSDIQDEPPPTNQTPRSGIQAPGDSNEQPR